VRISFEVNVKAVLAVTAIVVVAFISFFAGRHYQAAQSPPAINYDALAKQYGGVAVIPDSEAADSEVSWCEAHPNTTWTFGPISAESIKGLPAGSVVKPISGGCDELGRVWVVNDHK
jgi:hypothetical protein